MDEANSISQHQTQVINQQQDHCRDGLVSHMTINSVLHFLKSELLRLEQQRVQWEMDRAELQAQLTFLQGERKGQENLKQDLIRRIKMLEFALKSERVRRSNRTDSSLTDQSNVQTVKMNAQSQSDVPVPALKLSRENEKGQEYNKRWKESRLKLKQYLEEVGCSDLMLDLRQARLKSSFASHFGQMENNFDNSIKPIVNAVNALATLDENVSSASNPELRTQFHNLYEMLDQKDKGRVELDLSEQYHSTDQSANNENRSLVDSNQLNSHDLGDLNGLSIDNENQAGTQMFSKIDIETKTMADFGQKYKKDKINHPIDQFLTHNFTCRGHFDAIRAVTFHHKEPILFSASEDGTIMLWDMKKYHQLKPDEKEGSSNITELVDIEPSYVYRGHSSPVLSLTLLNNSLGGNGPTNPADCPLLLFSGSLDGKICSWAISPNYLESKESEGSNPKSDIFAPYQKSADSGFVYSDGTDTPIWALAISSSKNNILTAASGSGLISLYTLNDSTVSCKPFCQLNLKDELKRWIGDNQGDASIHAGRSTSLTFLTEASCRILGLSTSKLPLLLASSSTGWLCLLDMSDHNAPKMIDAIFTGSSSKNVKESAGDWNSVGIYSITVHPTFPKIWTGHDDQLIREFVIKRSETDDKLKICLLDSFQIHEDAVCNVECEQTAGLYLFSASYDGSVKVWDIEKKKCVQDIAVHRPKGQEPLHSLALHPNIPLLATAGADGLCKIFVQHRS